MRHLPYSSRITWTFSRELMSQEIFSKISCDLYEKEKLFIDKLLADKRIRTIYGGNCRKANELHYGDIITPDLIDLAKTKVKESKGRYKLLITPVHLWALLLNSRFVYRLSGSSLDKLFYDDVEIVLSTTVYPQYAVKDKSEIEYWPALMINFDDETPETLIYKHVCKINVKDK